MRSIRRAIKGGKYMSKLLIDSRLIGHSIKALRLNAKLTQSALAESIGYSVRNLRRIENDGTTSIDIVNTFAEFFKVSAMDILQGVSFLLVLLLKIYLKNIPILLGIISAKNFYDFYLNFT